MDALRLCGLTKCYGDFLALDDVNLSVPQGEFLRFWGQMAQANLR